METGVVGGLVHGDGARVSTVRQESLSAEYLCGKINIFFSSNMLHMMSQQRSLPSKHLLAASRS